MWMSIFPVIIAYWTIVVCHVWLSWQQYWWGRKEQPGSYVNEPPHDKTNKMACAPSEDLNQPGHLPPLIRVFAVRIRKARVLSYPLSVQRRIWSDWADAQADLSLHWAHSYFVGFVMRWLKLMWSNSSQRMPFPRLFKPRHEKNCLRGLRPGIFKSQTSLYSHRDYLEPWNFGYSK